MFRDNRKIPVSIQCLLLKYILHKLYVHQQFVADGTIFVNNVPGLPCAFINDRPLIHWPLPYPETLYAHQHTIIEDLQAGFERQTTLSPALYLLLLTPQSIPFFYHRIVSQTP